MKAPTKPTDNGPTEDELTGDEPTGEDQVLVGADENDEGKRLDRFLTERLELPRNQIQRWIEDGRVKIPYGRPKGSTSVQRGWQVEVDPPPPIDEDPRCLPEEGELRVLFEDHDIVVVDKPPGLAVHPGAGRPSGTLAHRLVARYPEIAGVGGSGRPGIVHRLDLNTSGVMVIARSARSYQVLNQAFAAREVGKAYLAIVWGAPDPTSGRIDRPIGRHPSRRKEMTVRDDGRASITEFRTIEANDPVSLLEVRIGTGRTHQIRVHLKSLGHPIIGDPVYGEARWNALPRKRQAPYRYAPRPALHAWRLSFDHPRDGQRVRFETPPPEDFRQLWQRTALSEFPPLVEAG